MKDRNTLRLIERVVATINSEPLDPEPDVIERARAYRVAYGNYASGYEIVGELIAECERLQDLLAAKD